MNIFLLDRDIGLNVQYHCDKHVVKMILESAQLLSSVHHMQGNPQGYTLTHKKHPCAMWARYSQENYDWLLEFTLTLGDEYTYRYGKIHKSIGVVENLPHPNLPYLGLTEHPKCVADDLKHIEDVVEAYRVYYIRDKGYMCKWTDRNIPEWFEFPA